MALFNHAHFWTLRIIHEPRYLPELEDTAGQDEYEEIRPLIYPQTDVFLICFSIDAPSSYENVTEKWIPEIKNYVPGAPFVLVGTRTDLRELCLSSEMGIPKGVDPETLITGFIDRCLRQKKSNQCSKDREYSIPPDIVKIVMRFIRFYEFSTIQPSEGHSLAKYLGAKTYVECSALTRDGLSNVFDEAIRATWNTDIVSDNKKKKIKCQIL